MPARFTFDRVVRLLLVLGGVALGVWLVWFFSDLVFYLVAAAVVAYLLGPFVTWIQGRGVPRVVAVLVGFVGLFAVVGLVVGLFVPFFAGQLAQVTGLLTPERLTQVAESVDRTVRQYLPSVPEGAVEAWLRETVAVLFRQDEVGTAVSSVVTVLGDVVAALVIVPFVAFFLLKDGRAIQAWGLRLVPNRYFEPTLRLLATVETTIGRYFRALFVQLFSVGLVATVLLGLVGLDGAIAVGLFTALANTIPYFGPPLGFAAGAVVGIAQTGDFSLVPWVALAMGLTQVADNVFFQPLYFSRAARVHPLVILCVVLIGARVAGLLGMLVAIPALTIVTVTVQQVLWSTRQFRLLTPSLRRAPPAPDGP